MRRSLISHLSGAAASRASRTNLEFIRGALVTVFDDSSVCPPGAEDELCAVIRLAYSQLPLDERGLTIWPSTEGCLITYRAICYGFFEELDALRGPEFESLAELGYDYVLLPAGDSRIDDTDVFARVKAEVTRAGRISRWLPNE